MTQRTCHNCGKPFEQRRSGGKPQVHCSDACRRAFATKAMNARRFASRPTDCAQCGAPITQPVTGRPRRFCSETCKMQAVNRRARRARLPLKQTRERTCAFCGKPFAAKRIDRIYCYSSWCNQAAYQQRKAEGTGRRVVNHEVECGECGTTFTAKHPSARWCSKTCANRHWGRVRSRRRRPLPSVAYTDREIYERDGWRCHLCRKPLNRDAAPRTDDAPTIDHLIPLALGGLDEPSNVAAAHWRCNREKGIKPSGEQLRLT